MALQIIKTRIDDIDKTSGARTMSFGFEGVSYEIDLAEANQARLQAALAPFIEKATKVGGRRNARRANGIDTSAVRAWARANGREVADRGRIPADIVEAYQQANR